MNPGFREDVKATQLAAFFICAAMAAQRGPVVRSH